MLAPMARGFMNHGSAVTIPLAACGQHAPGGKSICFFQNKEKHQHRPISTRLAKLVVIIMLLHGVGPCHGRGAETVLG